MSISRVSTVLKFTLLTGIALALTACGFQDGTTSPTSNTEEGVTTKKQAQKPGFNQRGRPAKGHGCNFMANTSANQNGLNNAANRSALKECLCGGYHVRVEEKKAAKHKTEKVHKVSHQRESLKQTKTEKQRLKKEHTAIHIERRQVGHPQPAECKIRLPHDGKEKHLNPGNELHREKTKVQRHRDSYVLEPTLEKQATDTTVKAY